LGRLTSAATSEKQRITNIGLFSRCGFGEGGGFFAAEIVFVPTYICAGNQFFGRCPGLKSVKPE
jgi:hypothetical protein